MPYSKNFNAVRAEKMLKTISRPIPGSFNAILFCIFTYFADISKFSLPKRCIDSSLLSDAMV